MALSESDRTLLSNIADDAKSAAQEAKSAREASIKAATLLDEHSKQITELFTQGRLHADSITTLKAEHDLCRKNQDPGNMAERKGNRIAFIALCVSTAVGALGLAVSIVVAAKTLL